MHRPFLEGTSSGMAMETLAIVVRLIEFDLRGLRGLSEVIDVKVSQAAYLGFETAEHRVVGVAGVAGFVRRNAVILVVRGRQMKRIIDMQALSIGLHDVTAQAESGALRTIQFSR